jgi:hypothetical protein
MKVVHSTTPAATLLASWSDVGGLLATAHSLKIWKKATRLRADAGSKPTRDGDGTERVAASRPAGDVLSTWSRVATVLPFAGLSSNPLTHIGDRSPKRA